MSKFLIILAIARSQKFYLNIIEKYPKSDYICKVGVSSNAVKVIISFLNMESELGENEEINQKIEKVTHEIGKYIPDLIRKIINVSEYFEKNTPECEDVSHNTKLLKELYSKLFKPTFNIHFPDFNLSKMIEDISEYPGGQLILLLVFSYIFIQILQLFRINYTIKS